MRNSTPVAEVVEDIIANMPEADKANVVNTPENNLITFHHGGGVPNRLRGECLVRIWSLNGNYKANMIKYPLWVRRGEVSSLHTCQLLSGKR